MMNRWKRGDEFSGEVQHCCDGDTIVVAWDESGVAAHLPDRVRLALIQAPEFFPFVQPGAMVARGRLEDLAVWKSCVCRVARSSLDKYGRLIAHVSVGGLDVGMALLGEGLVTLWRPRVQRAVRQR